MPAAAPSHLCSRGRRRRQKASQVRIGSLSLSRLPDQRVTSVPAWPVGSRLHVEDARVKMRRFSHHPWPDETQLPATPRPEMPCHSWRRAIRTIVGKHHRFDYRSMGRPDFFVRCILPLPSLPLSVLLNAFHSSAHLPTSYSSEMPTYTASIDQKDALLSCYGCVAS